MNLNDVNLNALFLYVFLSFYCPTVSLLVGTVQQYHCFLVDLCGSCSHIPCSCDPVPVCVQDGRGTDARCRSGDAGMIRSLALAAN